MLTKMRHFVLQHNVVFLLLLLILCFGSTTGPLFLNEQNIHNIARQISFDIPLALALTIVLVAGGIDLSVGSVLSMAAALTMGLQPLGTWFAVGVALLFGAAVGLINGLLVTKGRIVPFIATLGTMTVVRGAMLTYTRQQPIPGSDPAFTFWGAGSLGPVPVPILVVALLCVGVHLLLTYTQFGRNLYAIGGNADAAFLAGIQIERNKVMAFVLSGLLAAVSGVLIASRLNASTVHIGLDSGLWAIAAAIIGGASLTGGKGSTLGAVLGVVTLGVLVNGMNLLGVHTYYQIGVRAVILIAVVAVDALSAANLRKKLVMQSYGNRE
ncbi:MAG: ABC transporter permease [Chloroflexi bacterium]|nr:ABC transporter permease [Chloroflexota bacterium]